MPAPLSDRSYLPPEEPPFKTSGLAIYSVAMGLTAWLLLPLLGGIAAIVLGNMARLEIARSEGRLTGDGLAVAGLVLGYANIAFVALITICLAGLFLFPVLEKFLSS
jgi:hypothetical protein